MTPEEKELILDKAKKFFKDKIVENHKIKTKKAKHLKAFKVNPFLLPYLSKFAFGSNDYQSMAKTLAYPRIIGTSASTIFGTQMQLFCADVLNAYASTTSGIDIEFIDQVDGRKKYCQIKSGPNCINKDDVTTIKTHFKSITNLARTNRVSNFNPLTDCVVGVFYGEEQDLSASYKKIKQTYPVYIGQDFWHRLTGDANFYKELIVAITEECCQIDCSELLNDVIANLAKEIKTKQ